MNNPWKSIRLSDYENHMQLDNIMQLQVLNSMMQKQLKSYSVDNVMILGVAGGNGLEYIETEKYNTVYGVDVNSEYLQELENRYRNLEGIIKCICIDLISETEKLPSCDFIIANLLIEYIGYNCFQKVIKQVKPKYVSCGIQVNTSDEFVSDSPYLHSFDGLNSIHHQIEREELIKSMHDIRYKLVSIKEYSLPNGKKLLQADFKNSVI